MEITITNRVATSVLTFTQEEPCNKMLKAIDGCLEDSSKYITYNGNDGILKFSSDYLRNSLIEISEWK